MRRRQSVGFWAVLLLVLAASPVTAPFSSFDLADLRADLDPSGDGIVQIKTAKDEVSPASTGGPVLPVLPLATEPLRVGPMQPVARPAPLAVPLRL